MGLFDWLKKGSNSSQSSDSVTISNTKTFAFGKWRGQPLQWHTLKKERGKVLVITQDCIAVKPFHAAQEAANWQKCTLRKWLNKDFFNSAFTEEEKKRFLESENLTHRDNGSNGSVKSSSFITKDFIFLLSKEEVEQYFTDDTSRCAKMLWTKNDIKDCLNIK